MFKYLFGVPFILMFKIIVENKNVHTERYCTDTYSISILNSQVGSGFSK